MAYEQLLICDDDADTCEMLDLLLAEAGYRVFVAHDAGEVMAGIETTLPRCLIIDVHLPDHDGFWIARQLRSNQVDIPIIFITADTSYASRGAVTGFDGVDVLIKPLDPLKVLEKVRAATVMAHSSAWLNAVSEQ